MAASCIVFYSLIMIATSGNLTKLPEVQIENGFQVIPSIKYKMGDTVYFVNWCRTCNFYKYGMESFIEQTTKLSSL